MRNLWILTCLLVALTQCKLAETNENPNVPTEVPLSTLLPPAQKELSDALGGRSYRYAGIFSQHLRGVNNQELNNENYQPDELFVGYLWEDYYAGSMLNIKTLIDRGTEEGNLAYAGIGKVLMSVALGNLTDFWGDIPYEEALLGGENLAPGYTSQPEIYATIDALLAEALLDFDSPGAIQPGSDDLIYGGDVDRWRQAANALRARYALHRSKRDETVYAEALTHLQAAFTTDNVALAYPYQGVASDLNPIFGFYENTPDAVVDTAFTNLLAALDDPRQEYLYRNIPFSGGQRKPGDFAAAADAPLVFIDAMEQLFIEAECRLQTGDISGAQDALTRAVQQSFRQVSAGELDPADNDPWLQQYATLTGGDGDLETIITQKYIALFTRLEPWTDFRRTGFPALVPNANGSNSTNPGGEIPRRLIYPQSERLLNPNVPQPLPNMQTRFWWDE